jgi:hypothetical protein
MFLLVIVSALVWAPRMVFKWHTLIPLASLMASLGFDAPVRLSW